MAILLPANRTVINLFQIGGKQLTFPAVRASSDQCAADGKAEWRTVGWAFCGCQQTAIFKIESACPENSMVMSTFPPFLFSL